MEGWPEVRLEPLDLYDRPLAAFLAAEALRRPVVRPRRSHRRRRGVVKRRLLREFEAVIIH